MIPETYWRKSTTIVGPARAAEFGSIGQQRTRAALENYIISNTGLNSRVLDAGCNTGVEGYRLFASGYAGQYVGADSNPLALSHALENLTGRPASFLLSDLAAIPFPDKSFDVVFSKDVIEHAPTFEPILSELCRLTRGVLVLSMFIRMREGDDEIRPHPDGYYLNRYSRPRLLSFVKARGFASEATVFAEGEDEVLVFRRGA
ncbi:MAG: class I SAM-dependent methyltransferase [Deltaproteobacteria bacterium]|nr:class I SAM-dependent methyltransferase [Deltaproteobacteria bacterium]